MDKIHPVPIKEFLIIHWVAAPTIDKFVARLDRGVALTLRRDELLDRRSDQRGSRTTTR